MPTFQRGISTADADDKPDADACHDESFSANKWKLFWKTAKIELKKSFADELRREGTRSRLKSKRIRCRIKLFLKRISCHAVQDYLHPRAAGTNGGRVP